MLESKSRTIREIKALMTEDCDFLRPMLRAAIEEFLEAEMAEAVEIEPRSSSRGDYRTRSLDTRVGRLELRVPHYHNGESSTRIFERYRRKKEALVAALTEMYIQGVSARKLKAISDEFCAHSFGPRAISKINEKLDGRFGRFARRELNSDYPYLILEAAYEKVRKNGVSRLRALLVAFGIDWEGRRQVLGMERANRESSKSWKDFLLGLKSRGLRGVIFAVCDERRGLRRAVTEVLPEAC